QQQLPAEPVGIVVEEFLQIQHMLAQPRRFHRRDDRAHTPLGPLSPRRKVGARAGEYLFGGVAHTGPQPVERVDLPPRPPPPPSPGDAAPGRGPAVTRAATPAMSSICV